MASQTVVTPTSTTHTTSTSQTTSITRIYFDRAYLHTVPGLLKIVCLFLNIVGFILLQTSTFSSQSKGEFFSTVSMSAFWYSGITLLLYLFHVVHKFNRIPWVFIELCFCAVFAFLYMIASCLAAATGWESYEAASFFGFCAMCVYGYKTFRKFLLYRSGGEIVTRHQTVSVVIGS